MRFRGEECEDFSQVFETEDPIAALEALRPELVTRQDQGSWNSVSISLESFPGKGCVASVTLRRRRERQSHEP